MSKAKIYLPRQAENFDGVRQRICRTLSHEYSGVTVYSRAHGSWVDGDGRLIQEPVIVIETYGDIDHEQIEQLAESVRVSTNEDTIMYVIDNDAYFV